MAYTIRWDHGTEPSAVLDGSYPTPGEAHAAAMAFLATDGGDLVLLRDGEFFCHVKTDGRLFNADLLEVDPSSGVTVEENELRVRLAVLEAADGS